MTDAPLRSTSTLRRWLAPAVLVSAVLAAYFTGLHQHLSFASFVAKQDVIEAYVVNHQLLAVAAYMAIYVVVVALSLPGAALMSIAGGFLFGWVVGAPAAVLAATLGAVIVFQVVKTSLGAAMAERAGPLARKLSANIAEDAFNYLLFLRLVPAFPFFAVNAVAGLCNVKLRSFIAATVIGIIPGGLAFSYLGSGLGSVIEAQKASYATCVAERGADSCALTLDLAAVVTPQLLLALAGLGVVALIPVAVRKMRKPKGQV